MTTTWEIDRLQVQIKSNITLFYCVPFKVYLDIEESDFFPAETESMRKQS